MQFEYKCEECKIIFSKDFRIGQAEKLVDCPDCGNNECKRHYGQMSFILKGGGWPGKSERLNNEMTARNEAAGHRMRKEHKPPVNLKALDYGNGDVREVKSGDVKVMNK